MNKFSKLLNESFSFEEIEGHVLEISDVLGKPNVVTLNFGREVGYVFKWDLKFNVEEYNGSVEIERVKKLFSMIDEISLTMKRVRDYDVEFKIKEHLYVRFIPHTESSESYEFILGQKWREIRIDYSQVVKFFKDRGFRVKDVKMIDIEYKESTEVKIITDADELARSEFVTLFNDEANRKYIETEELNRLVICEDRGIEILIYPEEEKTFINIQQL